MITKLYELPPNTHFTFESHPDNVYFLCRIDGMYSYCLDSYMNVHHFAAYSDVVPYDKYSKVEDVKDKKDSSGSGVQHEAHEDLASSH